MKKKFQLLCLLVISALIITSCSPKKAAKYGVAATDTSDNSYKVLAVHENGERLAAITETDSSGNVTAVTGAVWFSPKGDTFVVHNSADGLPERISVGDFTILLSNYTNNTVDVAIVSSTGEIEVVKNVPVNSDELLKLKSLQNQGASLNGTFKLASLTSPILTDRKSISRTLRLASFTISVAGCVVAGILSTALTFGTALAVLAIPCGSAIVSGIQLLTEKEDDVALSATSKALGVVGCGSGSVGDCVGLILVATADAVSTSDKNLESQKQAIERAKLSVYLVGDWSIEYDWDCDGENVKRAIDNYNANGKVHSTDYDGDTAEGIWETSGNQYLLTYDNGTQYYGTVNGDKMEGTMTGYTGTTGCWFGERIQP